MRALLFGLLWSIPAWTGGNPYPTIGAIPLPAGYHRLAEAEGSFGAWLRTVGLKKGTTVYLYNGKPKENQDAQFAVLDVSVGHEDLQQCADAVMRLRAEYLYSRGEYSAIVFYTETGQHLNFAEWTTDRRRSAFDGYLREGLYVLQHADTGQTAGPGVIGCCRAGGCADPGRVTWSCDAGRGCGGGWPGPSDLYPGSKLYAGTGHPYRQESRQRSEPMV